MCTAHNGAIHVGWVAAGRWLCSAPTALLPWQGNISLAEVESVLMCGVPPRCTELPSVAE